MGSRMFLLLVPVLLIFTDHSQGVPKKNEKSSIAQRFPHASAVGEPLMTANPINTPRQHNRLCICGDQKCANKGHPKKVKRLVNTCCLCPQPARGNGKHEKPKMCKRNKNLKKCKMYGPSIPI